MGWRGGASASWNDVGYWRSSSYDSGVDDLETEFSLTQKRRLLELKKWLERQRTYRRKIEELEGILADKERSDNRRLVKRALKDYRLKLANADEAVELCIYILGLIDKKFDIKKQLAEISED